MLVKDTNSRTYRLWAYLCRNWLVVLLTLWAVIAVIAICFAGFGCAAQQDFAQRSTDPLIADLRKQTKDALHDKQMSADKAADLAIKLDDAESKRGIAERRAAVLNGALGKLTLIGTGLIVLAVGGGIAAAIFHIPISGKAIGLCAVGGAFCLAAPIGLNWIEKIGDQLMPWFVVAFVIVLIAGAVVCGIWIVQKFIIHNAKKLEAAGDSRAATALHVVAHPLSLMRDETARKALLKTIEDKSEIVQGALT